MPSVDDILREKPSGLYGRGEHKQRGFGGVPLPGADSGFDLFPIQELLRVPIQHSFEIHRNGVLDRVCALPIEPSDISTTRPSAVDLQYTLGGVEREHSPHRSMMIEISGRSGLAFRSGYNRQGEVEFLDGPSLLREFDAFLDYYVEQASGTGGLPDPEGFRDQASFELIFRDLRGKYHLKVEVMNWTRVASASDSRFSEKYTLTLHAYAPAQPVVPGNFLGPIADAALLTAAGINYVNNYIAVADNVLTNVNNDLQVLKAPFRALERTGVLANDLVRGASQIVDFPRTFFASATRALGQFRNAWDAVRDVGDIWESGLASAERPSPVERQLLRDAEEGAFVTIEAAAVNGGGPRSFQAAIERDDQFIQVIPDERTQAQDARAERGQRRDVLRYQVRLGDTPESIAQVYYGRADAWFQVVDYNGWINARTLPDGSPFRAGIVVQLPNTGYGELEARATTDTPQEIYGVDLLLDDEGDLVIDGNGGDVLTVTGVENLEQALLLRLTTVAGDAAYFPQYGLPLVVGRAISAELFGNAVARVREQFARDPRVRTIDNLAVLLEGDTLGIEFEVIPAHAGDPILVNAPLPTS